MLKAFFILSILGLSFSAQAYKIHQIDKLSNGWMQEVYQTAKDNRVSNKGICGSFEGFFAFEVENDEDLSLGLATMITRDAMMTYKPENMDIVTSSHIVMSEDDAEAHVKSAFQGVVGEKSDVLQSLVKSVFAHKNELDIKNEMYTGSVAYAMKVGNEGDYAHDIMNHFSLVDLEKKELFFIGSGQCEF